MGKKIEITQENLPIILAFLARKINAIDGITACVKMSKSNKPYIFVKTKISKYVVVYYFTHKNYKAFNDDGSISYTFYKASELYNHFMLEQWFEE